MNFRQFLESDLPFHRAIDEDPSSMLVYADYLEERGNPLGELIRIWYALGHSRLTPEAREQLQVRKDELEKKYDKELTELPVVINRGAAAPRNAGNTYFPWHINALKSRMYYETPDMVHVTALALGERSEERSTNTNPVYVVHFYGTELRRRRFRVTFGSHRRVVANPGHQMTVYGHLTIQEIGMWKTADFSFKLMNSKNDRVYRQGPDFIGRSIWTPPVPISPDPEKGYGEIQIVDIPLNLS